MKDLNIELIYDEYRDIFSMKSIDVSEFKEDAEFMYSFNTLINMAKDEESESLKKRIIKLEREMNKIFENVSFSRPKGA